MSPRLAVFLRALIERVKLSPATLAGLRKIWHYKPPVVVGRILLFCSLVFVGMILGGAIVSPRKPTVKPCAPCAAKRVARKAAALRPVADPMFSAKQPKEGK